jgi:hypothetical protein
MRSLAAGPPRQFNPEFLVVTKDNHYEMVLLNETQLLEWPAARYPSSDSTLQFFAEKDSRIPLAMH